MEKCYFALRNLQSRMEIEDLVERNKYRGNEAVPIAFPIATRGYNLLYRTSNTLFLYNKDSN